MQESFEVISSIGSYKVIVGANTLAEVLDSNPDAIYLIDACLENRLPLSIHKRIVVTANEKNKSLEAMPEVISQIRALGANRMTHLVVIGGGVLQDIGTFCASVYMRGVSWTYMPTTFLGMADSCIGGKSSINVLGYKNLVGNFYPPKDVVIDVNFIKSLNAEQIVGGLYEAAKICFARGYDYFQEYLLRSPSPEITLENAQAIILHSLKTKKWFIEIDEFDQKERLLLNYGHTFGHAIEAGTDFSISHGVAVGVGILVSIEYVKSLSILSESGLKKVNHLLLHIKSMLGYGTEGVIETLPTLKLDLIIEKFNNDKKHLTNQYRIVVPSRDGILELVSIEKSENSLNRISQAYMSVFKDIGWHQPV